MRKRDYFSALLYGCREFLKGTKEASFLREQTKHRSFCQFEQAHLEYMMNCPTENLQLDYRESKLERDFALFELGHCKINNTQLITLGLVIMTLLFSTFQGKEPALTFIVGFLGLALLAIMTYIIRYGYRMHKLAMYLDFRMSCIERALALRELK